MNRGRILIAAGALLVLGAVDYSILGKESVKRDGVVVYLDLMPRDPRSIMQGDYMTLRFRLAQDIHATVKPLPPEGDESFLRRDGNSRGGRHALVERDVFSDEPRG